MCNVQCRWCRPAGGTAASPCHSCRVRLLERLWQATDACSRPSQALRGSPSRPTATATRAVAGEARHFQSSCTVPSCCTYTRFHAHPVMAVDECSSGSGRTLDKTTKSGSRPPRSSIPYKHSSCGVSQLAASQRWHIPASAPLPATAGPRRGKRDALGLVRQTATRGVPSLQLPGHSHGWIIP